MNLRCSMKLPDNLVNQLYGCPITEVMGKEIGRCISVSPNADSLDMTIELNDFGCEVIGIILNRPDPTLG